MSLTRILPLIALIATLSLPTVVSAQVPVEVSDEKVVSGGRVYYMHEVQKNQPLYSISRAYRVTIDAITGENSIPPNGIQTGQVLRIPAAANQSPAPAQPRPAAQQTVPPTQPRTDPQATRPVRSTTAAARMIQASGFQARKSYHQAGPFSCMRFRRVRLFTR